MNQVRARARRHAIAKAEDQSQTAIWVARLLAVLAAMAIVLQATGAFARSAPESFSALAKKLLPTVVNISTTQTVEGRPGLDIPQLPPGSPFEDFFKDFFERNQPQNRSRKATSLGSGFIVGCERVVSKVSGAFAPSSDPTYCAGRGRERRRHAGEATSLCVREFDRDGWQASVRRKVAPPASVSLGAAGENAFAVVVPDADCE